jgi:hypothetical protein
MKITKISRKYEKLDFFIKLESSLEKEIFLLFVYQFFIQFLISHERMTLDSQDRTVRTGRSVGS